MSGAGQQPPPLPYDPSQQQQQQGGFAPMGSMLPPGGMPMAQWDASGMQVYPGAQQMPQGAPWPQQQQHTFQSPVQQEIQQQPFSMGEVDAFSAIHAPIDFGDLMGGGGGGAASEPSTFGQYGQQAPLRSAGLSTATSDAGSSALHTPLPLSVGPSGASTPSGAATGGKATAPKPSRPKKSKAKAKAEADAGDGAGVVSTPAAATPATTGAEPVGDAAAPKKKAKPRAPKAAKDEAGGEAKPKQPRPRKRKADTEGGTAAKGGRASGGASRRPSQASVQGMAADVDTPGGDDSSFVIKNEPGSESVLTSRAGSVAPATGESTPTKRGGRASGGGRGRGGRGAAARRSTAGRAGSRASRATSGRMTASVAPGGGQENGTVAPEDAPAAGDEGADGEEYDDAQAGAAADDEDEEDENVDLGLEEDELDRQEAIQRQRSINMAPLMKAMTAEQQDRYAAFRRHYLNKTFVRRLVHHLTRQVVTPQVTTLVAGVGKVFIGEIVERARRIRQETGSTSRAIRPEHLVEALREYREEREVPGRYPPGAVNAGPVVGANGKTRRMF